MMDPASPTLQNPSNFPDSPTFVCSKSSIAILKIPDPLVTITNYRPSPNKCSCKNSCSCPPSTPSKAISSHNSPKSLNSLNHHDFSTNSPPTINQSGPKPQIDKNAHKRLTNVKTEKSVYKNTENPAKLVGNSSRNSATSCKSNLRKPSYRSKNLNGKGRKCSRKLKRLKTLSISSNNTLGNSINLNKSIKVRSDKCVGTYDVEESSLERGTFRPVKQFLESLKILEHLGEAESLLKLERELRFSQIRSDYSLVRDRIEEKFHLVVMCCRKRQAELSSKYMEELEKIEGRLSRVRLPTLSHIRKELEFFN